MGSEPGMNDRMCIVTKQRRQPGELLRFVAAPDGRVDRRRLPSIGPAAAHPPGGALNSAGLRPITRSEA